MTTRTYSPRASEIERQWFVVDANGETLGRLATRIATLLAGKHKPTYATHMDTGDHVIVINAEKVKLTGHKEQDKMYRHHTGYPGGLKETTATKLRATRPIKMVELAIQGMLPKNKLGKQMYRKLNVYAGDRHPHAAQKPVVLAVKRKVLV